MKITSTLFKLNIRYKFSHVPGNILTGKHRIWPRLTPGVKRHLLRSMEREMNNMKFISNSYFGEKEDANWKLIREREIELEERKKVEDRRKKTMFHDRHVLDHLSHLNCTKKWE
ncbi:hypothetical protein SNEBB_003400 [Seison nebaliae]|nr:hypothetical protein SNEBB_003400 [Seison nebaliae]